MTVVQKIESVLMSDISGFDSSVAVNGQTLSINIKNKIVSYNIDILPVPNSGTVFKLASDKSVLKIANGGSYHFEQKVGLLIYLSKVFILGKILL